MRRNKLGILPFVFLAALLTSDAFATQPLEFKSVARGDFASILTVSGSIHQVTKQSGMIALFANKPFWGPPHFGAKQFALWPADTLFIARVPGGIPITIDGKKAGFAELAVGQQVQVEYNIVLSSQEGYAGRPLPYMYCGATRIAAHTALSPKEKSEGDKRRKR